MWDALELVPLEVAKDHLRVTTSDEDEDIEVKLQQAQAMVLDYIDRPDDTDWHAEMLAWTATTAPKAVQAAIVRQLMDLRRFRGDDPPAGNAGLFLSPWVAQCLRMYRDPVLA